MDLQDLLDEVESVIQDRPPATKRISSVTTTSGSGSSSSSYSTSGPVSKKKTSSNELDDLLDMIKDDNDGSTEAAVHPARFQSNNNQRREDYSAFASKCAASSTQEFRVGGTKKACSNLRCNDCDFTVVQFSGKAWTTDADYMFFRENVPNETRLRARMDIAPDSTAYACQCKWLSVDAPSRVDACRVKWACAGH
ncbi:hypothetical protein ATCC90586_000284 [Pythium insidiosum]|nr:hypothetical protein ATCC90586_000284 [Pythium insidiosum]